MAALALAIAGALSAADSLSLAGEWRFRLAGNDPGQAMPSAQTMFLPGSTDQAGYGNKTSGPEKGWLSRPYTYEGPAWYEREVVVPPVWRGKRITLFLERAHWQTQVWVDGRAFGAQDSLSTPHVYDLTAGLAPGRHRITMCVDNTYRIDVGRNAHSVTEHTQTNWNGVAGAIELRVTDPVWIDSVELTPGRARVTVGNVTGGSVSGQLRSGGAVREFVSRGREDVIEIATLPASGRWSEFGSALYPVTIELSAGAYRDRWSMLYGSREISTKGGQFLLNGQPTFLRGTVECNIFPLTGYPATDERSWMRIFTIARSYGVNHFRFHSNTPPEAAFAAADKLGMMLHVELPVWTKAKDDPKLQAYMRAEGYRILKAYGNHPSFTMLGLGNEFVNDFAFLDQLVAEFKKADPRRLYTFSADHTGRGPSAHSDYYVGQRTKNGTRMRIHGTRFANDRPSTDYDYAAAVADSAVPVVAHELGQWVTFPDYSEIAEYTGVLKPRNLEAFRAALADRGMADQAKAFQQASGKFAWLLYKEDIEAALRTPHYGGVQLLQLEDFPGQGEALIGLLDSFWESKGILAPEEMRAFFGPTVPLARIPKFTWTAGETLSAKVEVAHYGAKDVSGAKVAWSVYGEAGQRVASGEFAADLKRGEVANAGEIRVPVEVSAPERWRIAVDAAGGRNRWDVWVYPRAVDTGTPGDVIVTRSYDAAARAALAAGKKVLLLWPPERASASTMANTFLPVFWSLSWFPSQPGTLGILCDPKHSALAEFPTEAHSNFQWWDVTQPSRAFVLDETPAEFRPIVQVIDDYHRNHKLGAVFETRVGPGKLLVAGYDLESRLEERPAARQLRRSLLDYMSGAAFAPAIELPRAVLEKILSEAK